MVGEKRWRDGDGYWRQHRAVGRLVMPALSGQATRPDPRAGVNSALVLAAIDTIYAAKGISKSTCSTRLPKPLLGPRFHEDHTYVVTT